MVKQAVRLRERPPATKLDRRRKENEGEGFRGER